MFEIEIEGGRRLLVRPVVPADRAHLLAGFRHLSERSRFFRFLGAMARLSEADLERFTAPSDAWHGAFGALDISADPPRPVAIARYERLAQETAVAEMAVTVIDPYQGCGVGTLMIATTAWCAAHAGIGTFIAFVHPENTGMAHLMLALGASVTDRSPSEIVFRMPIHREADAYPDNRRGEMLRHAYRLLAGPAPGVNPGPQRGRADSAQAEE